MIRNLIFLLLPIFFLACQISGGEGIHQILSRNEEGLWKKGLSLYLSCNSKAYRDKE